MKLYTLLVLAALVFAIQGAHNKWIGCKWQIGDGTGGTEKIIGKFRNPLKCIQSCKKKPKANGATVDSRTGRLCYCEFGTTGRNSNVLWKTCKFTPKVINNIWKGCKWQVGDATGGTEKRIGRFRSPQKCIQMCQRFRNANGATVDSQSGRRCYCEFGATGRKYNTFFKTCKFTPKGQQCGQPAIQALAKRVIAGKNAVRGAWPWQILMSYNGKALCGGTLVANNWVVTAAHCVDGGEHLFRHFRIRFAEHDRRSTNKVQIDIPIKRIIKHKKYSKKTIDFDIAMIQLSRPVKGNRYVIPACLPRQNEHVPVGTQCYITGWGRIQHPGVMHHTLQQARLPVVSNLKCSKLNTRSFKVPITKRMLCAGHGGATRKGGCQGDSGGPFVCKTGANGAWVLHGVVSWGNGKCNSKKAYTVFTRVAYFTNWIKKNMKRYSQSG